ncbi:MAG: DUF5985 family protein [Rhizomicrobium sp.]
MNALAVFLTGMNTAGCLVAGFLFFRFWRRTQDFLFLAFGLAFLLFAANQAAVALLGIPRESQSWIYLLRLAGFTLIIVAILRKNLRGTS